MESNEMGRTWDHEFDARPGLMLPFLLSAILHQPLIQVNSVTKGDILVHSDISLMQPMLGVSQIPRQLLAIIKEYLTAAWDPVYVMDADRGVPLLSLTNDRGCADPDETRHDAASHLGLRSDPDETPHDAVSHLDLR
ncbi:hypothetical protein DPMN_163368, partial [Dreissena polymorpha]